MKQILLILIGLMLGSNLLRAQTGDRRPLTRHEVQFLAHKVDSIKKNLNRMIFYEKELRQRNYFLNEKTGMVDELIATIKYLQNSTDIIALRKADIRKIFGKPGGIAPGKIIYEIETFESNCPFMEITFQVKDPLITKVDYRITECQKWK